MINSGPLQVFHHFPALVITPIYHFNICSPPHHHHRTPPLFCDSWVTALRGKTPIMEICQAPAEAEFPCGAGRCTAASVFHWAQAQALFALGQNCLCVMIARWFI